MNPPRPTRRSLSIALTLICIAGCAKSRPPRTQAQLLDTRTQTQLQLRQESLTVQERLIERIKREYDQQPDKSAPPVLDILIISGGGDWGAFGAGFLKGWGTVTDPAMKRPEFDIVTGVSTGALIAPFAFVGTDESIEKVVQLYRNPKKDWVKQRWPLYFLPSNISFAEVPGLERELRANIDETTIRQIADGERAGRFIGMNTTNIDDGSMRVWDVGAEAVRATETGDTSRVHDIMLASSGIPGAFPYREIDGQLYVDGGVTGNIIYGGRIKDEESFSATWKTQYPALPMPKVRYWVIFNNQIVPLPQVTRPSWTAVIARSLEMGTRSATVTSMRHLHAIAEISRLKYGADVEVRIVAVPGDWKPAKPGVFIKEVMNDLVDLGEKMGADPAVWMTDPPP